MVRYVIEVLNSENNTDTLEIRAAIGKTECFWD